MRTFKEVLQLVAVVFALSALGAGLAQHYGRSPWFWCAYFLGVYLVALFGQAWQGRWLALAAHYRAGDLGKVGWRRSSLTQIGESALSGAMRYISWVAITDRGLALKTSGPFRPFHPPLLIPWECVARVRERRWFGMTAGAVLELSTPTLEISLPPELLEELEERVEREGCEG